MSTDEKVKEEESSTEKKPMGDMLNKIKSMNPKVLFGIVGVALVALFFLMSGGGGSGEMKIVSKSLQIGQTYTLKNPNAASDISDTSIVTAPGNLEVYDRSKQDGSVVCAAPKDTGVKVLEFADAFGKKDLFAQVEVLDGGCKGKKGWVMVSNIVDK